MRPENLYVKCVAAYERFQGNLTLELVLDVCIASRPCLCPRDPQHTVDDRMLLERDPEAVQVDGADDSDAGGSVQSCGFRVTAFFGLQDQVLLDLHGDQTLQEAVFVANRMRHMGAVAEVLVGHCVADATEGIVVQGVQKA